MTVRELTEYLLREDPDTEVLVNGYEDGFDPISRVCHKFVKPHSNPAWYYGKYEENSDFGSNLTLVLSRF